MSAPRQPTRSAIHLRACVTELRAALRITDRAERKAALRRYYFPVPSAPFKYVLLIFNFITSAAFAVWIARGFYLHPRQIWFMPLACVVALFSADLVSAIFHKWLDSYASELNPLWGAPAKAFRIHHEFPENLNQTTFLHNSSAFATLTAGFHGLFFLAFLLSDLSPLAGFTIWLVLFLFANGSEIHKQAHRKEPWAWIRVFQKTRILLNRATHIKHHSKGGDSDYGIINGWSNRVASQLGVWRRLDLFFWNRLGKFPNNWIQRPATIPAGVMLELSEHPERIPAELAIYLEAYPSRLSPSVAKLLSGRFPARIS
jgi:hypothetical protein